jgi:hypothetical protein
MRRTVEPPPEATTDREGMQVCKTSAIRINLEHGAIV